MKINHPINKADQVDSAKKFVYIIVFRNHELL